MDSHHFDIVVIGAGLSGIASAKFYLDIHPQCRLVVLERDEHVGGAFNSRRIYDHFFTQWPVEAAAFSDLPMARPPSEDTYYDFFNAKYTTQYLENYIDHHKYANQTLREKIRFGFEVENISKKDSTWSISGKEKRSEAKIVFSATKVIVASGLASTPLLPNLPCKERFLGPILHQENFGQSSILSSADIQRVTVLGGGKSAGDMVYALVKAGKSVTWVIRTPGSGPGFFLPAKGKGPYKNAFAMGSTRLAATLTPSFFNPDNWWTKSLHSSSYGRKILNSVWNRVDKEIRDEANFDGRTATRGFEKLAPHSPIFWQNQTGGLLNRPDFWDTIAQNAKIYEDEILQLDKGVVQLKSGETIPTDAILCGTGWTPSLDFFSENLLAELGLPHVLTISPTEEQQKWARLQEEADQKVLTHFPQLGNPPDHYQAPIQSTPYRLYKGIAPLNCDSIAFVGHVLVGSYFRAAECQAIWATAYLDKQLAMPSLEERQAEVALFTAWCRRRYLSRGERGNWMVFELISYTDDLLEGVGLSSHRKGWFSDLFVPCVAGDLRGLKDEYVRKYGDNTNEHGNLSPLL